jgi:hypothetical protein
MLRRLRARRAALAAGLGCVLVCAFCAAQSPATSADEPPPTPASMPAPAAEPPPAPSAEPPPAEAPPPRPPGPPIALVLPLESPDYARAAEAVRDGFLAAAAAAGAKDRVRVIPHAADGVLAAFDEARRDGARVVVGPLVRDDLRAVAASDQALPVTIALNQLDDTAALPPRVYTFALAIESDARTIARRMHDDGIANVAVVGSDSPLMRRFAQAFVAEWILAGGNPPQSYALVPTQDGLRAMRRDLARAPIDAIVMAVDGPDAALVKTFAPRVTTWASAQVNQRLDTSALRDLDEVRFVDVSWIVAPDAAAFAKLPRPEFASAALDRLYALGLDAFRVADAFVTAPPDRLSFDGATGHVELSDARQIAREGRLAMFRAGAIVPLDAPR